MANARYAIEALPEKLFVVLRSSDYHFHQIIVFACDEVCFEHLRDPGKSLSATLKHLFIMPVQCDLYEDNVRHPNGYCHANADRPDQPA